MCLWMAGNAFKIDRISRLEEDWNGRYAAAVHYSQDCAVRYVRICNIIFEKEREKPRKNLNGVLALRASRSSFHLKRRLINELYFKSTRPSLMM